MIREIKFSAFFLLLLLSSFYSCNFSEEDNHLNGIKKGGDMEMVFSKDLLNVDIYFNNIQFEDREVGEIYDKAMENVKAKKFDNAQTFFLKADQLDPGNPVILNSLGSIAAEFQEYELAVDYHQQAIELSDSTYTGAISNLGLAYLELKEYEKALAAYERVLQNTNIPALQTFAWYSISLAYLGMADCEEAKAAFEEFHERTKNTKNYAVLIEHLYLKVADCGKIIPDNRKNLRIDNTDYTFSVEQLAVKNSRDSLEQVSVLKLQQRETEELSSSRNVSKADFQLDLYTEFFENAELTSTEIAGALNKRLYLISRLSRKDSSRYAEIGYIIQLQKDKIGNTQIKAVSYSEAEEKAREMTTAE